IVQRYRGGSLTLVWAGLRPISDGRSLTGYWDRWIIAVRLEPVGGLGVPLGPWPGQIAGRLHAEHETDGAGGGINYHGDNRYDHEKPEQKPDHLILRSRSGRWRSSQLPFIVHRAGWDLG